LCKAQGAAAARKSKEQGKDKDKDKEPSWEQHRTGGESTQQTMHRENKGVQSKNEAEEPTTRQHPRPPGRGTQGQETNNSYNRLSIDLQPTLLT